MAAEADLLVNISGHLRLPELMRAVPRAARTSTSIRASPRSGTPRAPTSALDGARHVTSPSARTSARPGCDIPTGGFDWLPCRRRSCSTTGPSPAARTRAASRRSAAGAARSGASSTTGARYGLKVHEFRKVIDLPQQVPLTFELALDIHPGDHKDRDGARGGRLAAGRPARRVRRAVRVPRLRPGLGRRVLGRAGHLRRDPQRVVQRPHGPLPRLGQARARPGHRLQPTTTRPPRAWSRSRTLEEAAARRGGSPPTTRRTRPRRARSPRSASTPTGSCPRFLEQAGVT